MLPNNVLLMKKQGVSPRDVNTLLFQGSPKERCWPPIYTEAEQ